MVFTKRLREGVRRGEITCSVRIWKYPHVRVGARYPMEEGEIEIDSIEPIGLPDITPMLARESGFLGVVDLLKIGRVGERATPKCDSLSPHRTGRADFPHPALLKTLASGIHRQLRGCSL
jgi:hypothetical protein